MFNRVAGLMSGAVNDAGSGFACGLPMVRADLHCHSIASNEADEAMLNAIDCPESYSDPREVYEQAKSRKMDFVTVTDHDSLEGIRQLSSKPDHFVGEELTCYFPEDRCKMHILVWGLNDEDHQALRSVADDIYKVATILVDRNLAHAVAHPVYRQNDLLERWHLERLVLMFKGFETLNGAHSVLHRQSLEPLLNGLTAASIAELSKKHGMPALWPLPHIKAHTGGSDDHGLFNIGRTWTEFPGDVKTVDQLLECLRTARCRPGGEAGSSLKLAHNFFSVGIRYYSKRLTPKGKSKSMQSLLLGSLIGQQPMLRRRDWVRAKLIEKTRSLGRRLASPFMPGPRPTGSALLLELFLESCGRRFGENEALGEALRTGRAALGEHAAMFDFLSQVNRDIARGIADSVSRSLDRRELTGVFDAVSAVATHQFILLPYYFALFHQNRERQLLSRITGHGQKVTGQNMKLGVFTDTFDEVNGVGRFIQDMSRIAIKTGRTLIAHTCTENPTVECASRKNFKPLLSRAMPFYAAQPLTIPPLAEVLEWADRQQFDAIHVHTPGPMGLCGWLVAKMLRIPLLSTYHTDFPGYVNNLTGDYRLTAGTVAWMKWFYSQPQMVLSRSKEYRHKLRDMGLAEDKLAMTLPGVDNEKFSPQKRDMQIWNNGQAIEGGIKETFRLFYAGRVSTEKNLPFLADAFKRLCENRRDVALVIAGDGPYLPAMQKLLGGYPVYFLGIQDDKTLPGLYASSDLFVFPSNTDTLGQVVIESQASGLPVLVSNQGGPKEVMDDGITGLVLPTVDASAWASAIDSLLNDDARRQRMGRSAALRMVRYSLANTFEVFWEEHVKAAAGAAVETPAVKEEPLSAGV